MLFAPSDHAHGEGRFRLREWVYDATNRVVAGVERGIDLTQDRCDGRHDEELDQPAPEAGVSAEAERHERARLVMLVAWRAVTVNIEAIRLWKVLR